MKDTSELKATCDPVHINDTAWFYNQENGIDLLYEIRLANGDYLRTDHIKIPWNKLRASYIRWQARKLKEAAE